MARSSEERELDRLVSEHLPTALRFATRLTGDVDRAEDVLQEALVRVGSQLEDVSGRGTVSHVVVSHRDQCVSQPLGRRRPSADDSARNAGRPASGGSGQGAQDRELAELIAERVSALPERQREVMVLTSFEGFSVQEAAKLLEITEANVYSTLAVARARLSKELAPYFVRR